MGWVRRLGNLFQRERMQDEIERELRVHLEMEAEENLRSGMNGQEARRAARLSLGNPVTVREQTLASDAVLAVEGAWRDLRHAFRELLRTPVFTAAAVLTLALGIGATTAIFTLVDEVMLRSLPVNRPGELWLLGNDSDCCYSDRYDQGNWRFFSWEAYRFFRNHTDAFADMAAFQPGMGNADLGVRRAGSREVAQSRNGEYVSGNFFRTLGVPALYGRMFNDEDDREGAPPVTVMNFRTWQQKYASDPSLVGSTFEINGHAMTLVGIAPEGFYGAKLDADSMPDFWLPLTSEPLIAGVSTRLKDPRSAWLDVIGRLRPEVSHAAVESQMKTELQQWLASHRADMSQDERQLVPAQTLHLLPGGSGVSTLREGYGKSLKLLLAASLCVLLVACANIANLLLARGLRNRPQVALRAALGASRISLMRRALAQSLVLALLGAAAGTGVAYAGVRLMLHLAFGSDWTSLTATPSLPVLGFSLGLAMLTAIAAGTVPAWFASRTDPMEALRGVGRALEQRSGFGTGALMQRAMVVVQVAASLVLLSAAAMLGTSLRNIERRNVGFDPHGRYLVGIDTKILNYPQERLTPLFRAITDRLQAIPDVQGTAAALHAPLTGGWTHEIRIAGRSDPGLRDDMSAEWTRVTPGFFATFQNRIVMGRSLTEEDNAGSRAVAVVNESFAREFFGTANPIGQHFGPIPSGNSGMYEIVGVAADMALANQPDGPEPVYYLPEAQTTVFHEANNESRELWSHYLYDIVLWAPGDHPDLAAQIRSALADVDPNLVANDITPYSGLLGDEQQNMIASLASLFGAIALTLAVIGLYGVTSYGAGQRRTEIGVRMALGADRVSVVRLILRTAMLEAGIGIAIGLPASIAAGYLISSRLFGVKPWEPMLLVSAALLLALSALGAALVPACRAAAANPVEALRAE
ncbi:ADOP family duplicated permease [Silvibacterium acidisoli]|uniref:ADOP family duplicated permease n=1 Tax=Acidobacteriaceae bacterium ZG23-2 TaxID=2883246 RepID=UPI00406C2970